MPTSTRFVALGDSFTEGLHDELAPDGRHRGWADRVAGELATEVDGFRYANLAVRGRLLTEVIDQQVPVALASGADLVSFHAGGNDVLRPSADLAVLATRYDEAVARLRATGATVVLFTVLERAGSTGRFASAVARRIARFNAEVVRPAAARHGATLVDLGPVPALHDRRLWADDRLHLAPAGHLRVAAAVLEALGVDDAGRLGGPPGWWQRPLDWPARGGRAARTAADLRWARQHLAPWVGRRLRGVSSGDTVTSKRPELTPLDGA